MFLFFFKSFNILISYTLDLPFHLTFQHSHLWSKLMNLIHKSDRRPRTLLFIALIQTITFITKNQRMEAEVAVIEHKSLHL